MLSKTRRGLLRSLLLSLVLLGGVLVPVSPARAAWGESVPVLLQVYGYTSSGTMLSLGRAEGTLQFDDGGHAFRYSLTFCRQSSYQLPYLAVSVNVSYIGGRRTGTTIATVNPPYSGNSTTQPCYSSTATVAAEHSYANHYNVELQLFGSTFIGQSHTVFMEDQLARNPY